MKWLAKMLYPDIVNELGGLNLHDEVKKFYKLFLHFDLNDKQILDIK